VINKLIITADAECDFCDGKGIYAQSLHGDSSYYKNVICHCVETRHLDLHERVSQLEWKQADLFVLVGKATRKAQSALTKLKHARRERKRVRDIIYHQLKVRF